MDMICRCSLFTKEMLCLYLIESSLIDNSYCYIVHDVISDESYNESWSSNDVYQSVYRLPIYLTVCLFVCVDIPTCLYLSPRHQDSRPGPHRRTWQPHGAIKGPHSFSSLPGTGYSSWETRECEPEWDRRSRYVYC